jgi:hypothetical protein
LKMSSTSGTSVGARANPGRLSQCDASGGFVGLLPTRREFLGRGTRVAVRR